SHALIGTRWDGDVARIDIRRHERRNALNTQLCRSLESQAQTAADTARCIVITGQGPAFCAGADLDGVYGSEFIDALYGMLHGLQTLPIPVIAAVNGPAIGAGTQLAMACDVRVCDAGARFAVPTARNGMAVDAWTIRRLRDLPGAGTAARLMLLAETIDVDEAISCGLAQRRGTVDDAMRLAHDVAAYAPLS